ncbi:MAG: hypothetical protein GXY44_03715 [Phycisphaerales bacterium]|nr:hypothetical protein [Phycisphaerales bacterium]
MKCSKGRPFDSIRCTSPIDVMYYLLNITAAFLAAKGIREFGELLLNEPVYPWYARRGAVLFLMVGISLLDGLLLYMKSLPFSHFGLGLDTTVWLSANTALILIWIVLLDWPNQPVYRQPPPPAQLPGQQPFTWIPPANNPGQYPFGSSPPSPDQDFPPMPPISGCDEDPFKCFRGSESHCSDKDH